MFYPILPSSLLAQHDAWLAEMQEEPSYPVADKSVRIRYHDAWLQETHKEPPYAIANNPVPPRRQARLLCCLGKWLVSAGLRLQARYVPEIPPASEPSPFPTSG